MRGHLSGLPRARAGKRNPRLEGRPGHHDACDGRWNGTHALARPLENGAES